MALLPVAAYAAVYLTVLDRSISLLTMGEMALAELAAALYTLRRSQPVAKCEQLIRVPVEESPREASLPEIRPRGPSIHRMPAQGTWVGR